MSLLTRSAAVAAVMICITQPTHAGRIENAVAVFAALDKVTARISELEVPIDQTVEFGALKITARICNSRPPTERPKTTTFVEIDEIKLDGSTDRLFTGWMLAESPGLNALEHPVFDVWLTGCKTPQDGVAATSDEGQESVADDATIGEVPRPQEVSPFPRRRRFRR